MKEILVSFALVLCCVILFEPGTCADPLGSFSLMWAQIVAAVWITLVGQSPPTTGEPPFSSFSFLLSSPAQRYKSSPRHTRAVVGGVADPRAVRCGPV